jgi:Flp pilus assembly protein TadG
MRIGERGASLVELVVALPLLVIVLIGTVDFARVFYSAIEVTEAARAAAQFGATNESNSTNTAGMQAAAANAAPDVTLHSVSAGRVCECVDNTNAATRSSAAACTSSDCTGATHLVISVTVTAVRAFTTISMYPGIPHTITITRGAMLRLK